MACRSNQNANQASGQGADAAGHPGGMSMKKVCHFSSAHRGLDIRIHRKQCALLALAGFDVHLVIDATPADIAQAAGAGVTIHPLASMAGRGRLRRMLVQTGRCYRIAKALDADGKQWPARGGKHLPVRWGRNQAGHAVRPVIAAGVGSRRGRRESMTRAS